MASETLLSSRKNIYDVCVLFNVILIQLSMQ